MRKVARKAPGVLFLLACGLAVGQGMRYYREIERAVVDKFSGKRWEFPSKIYADSLLLYPGMSLEGVEFFARLERLNYRQVDRAVEFSGEYSFDPGRGVMDLYLHRGSFPAGEREGKPVHIFLRDGRVIRMVDRDTGEELFTVELEPEVITGIYDRTWEERRVIALHEVPSLLIKAILVAEDQRFFEHHGVDILGIARAMGANLRAGRVVQGGSTLTQQLMKNFFLTSERSIRRKIVEILMALVAERHYSKLAILENYLNEIYLGQRGAQGIFGVWEGAHFYFGKDPKDLTLAEMALLAGLIKAPNRYSPYRDPELAMKRRNSLLARLLEQGEISDEEYHAARLDIIRPRPLPAQVNDAPYFVDVVKHELGENYPAEVLTGEGLRIFTSLDLHLQRLAQDALENGLRELEARYPRLGRAKPKSRLQGCVIALQPQTGEIKAMVGGRDYRISQFNRVTQARRQPGSIFKPIVYLTALDQGRRNGGFLPNTRVEDSPFSWHYDNRVWLPTNYNDTYFGSVTLRQALELSLNSATARVAREVGIQPIRSMARRLGIVSPLPPYPSFVLGAMEVTPLEVAQAFAVIANQGTKAVPLAIKKVVGRDGKVIERRSLQVEQVVPPQTTFLLTHLLQGVLERGTGRGARARGFVGPAAGKTGTTNDFADAWFAGYTPDLLAVVWVGFDRRASLGLSGAQAALPIWTDFIKKASAGRPPSDFSPPPGVVLVPIDRMTGYLATSSCPEVIVEAFFAGTEPTVTCPRHEGE